MIDKVIGYISPKAGAKRVVNRAKLAAAESMGRAISNSGYANHGASLEKKALKGWLTQVGSALEDIERNIPSFENAREIYTWVPL